MNSGVSVWIYVKYWVLGYHIFTSIEIDFTKKNAYEIFELIISCHVPLRLREVHIVSMSLVHMRYTLLIFILIIYLLTYSTLFFCDVLGITLLLFLSWKLFS